MTRNDKLKKKFFQNPKSLKYLEIEKLLIISGFEKISIKGSHIKFKHYKMNRDIVVPVHNRECDKFYKEMILKEMKKHKI